MVSYGCSADDRACKIDLTKAQADFLSVLHINSTAQAADFLYVKTGSDREPVGGRRAGKR